MNSDDESEYELNNFKTMVAVIGGNKPKYTSDVFDNSKIYAMFGIKNSRKTSNMQKIGNQDDFSINKLASLTIYGQRQQRQQHPHAPPDTIARALARDYEFNRLRAVYAKKCKQLQITEISLSIERLVLTTKLFDILNEDSVFTRITKDFPRMPFYYEHLKSNDEKTADNIYYYIVDEISLSIDNIIKKAKSEFKYEYIIDVKKQNFKYVMTIRNIAESDIILHEHNISNYSYNKLKTLFADNNSIDADLSILAVPALSNFDIQLFLILCRYNTIGKTNYQYAHQKVFDILEKVAPQHVHECFSSPFNQNAASYTTAFPDTDSIFGSRGNFFSYEILPGFIYECNPPFIELHIQLTVNKILHALEKFDGAAALSFLLILPNWSDANYYHELEKSLYLRNQRLQQHSAIFLLQNAAAVVEHKIRIEEIDSNI